MQTDFGLTTFQSGDVEDNFRVAITEPFQRLLGFECATIEEAERLSDLLRMAAYEGALSAQGIPAGTIMQTNVVPTKGEN